jgi:hypothetical protein
MDFAIRRLAEKQSFMAFRKAYDSPFIEHSGCFWEFASRLHCVMAGNFWSNLSAIVLFP